MTNGNNKFQRWNEALEDPSERCEGVVATGPCPYKKAEGQNFCPMHGSNKGRITQNKEIKRNYRLQRWQNRVAELAESDQAKDLREEIGILRIVMEEMLNKCEDSTDLLLYAHRISDLAVKIERLVISCDKLENRMGLLLSKQAVLQLANTYVQIINTYVQDTDVIEKISTEMIAVTEAIENPVES